jgi:hypothetical protein
VHGCSRLTVNSGRSAQESACEEGGIAMKEINIQKFAILAVTVLCAGCESTGDPREGGIFWSETKARDRQQALVQESHASWNQANRERAENARLRSSIAGQRNKLAAMQSELSNLRRSAANSEVASDVTELERKRTELEKSTTENTEQLEGQVRDLQTEIDRLKERNNLLQETR